MNKSATAKTIASIAACVLAGALLFQCSAKQPVEFQPFGSGGGGNGASWPEQSSSMWLPGMSCRYQNYRHLLHSVSLLLLYL